MATYYVSQSGNNGNPGTEMSPWKTLYVSVPRLSPGDILKVRGGTWLEAILDPGIAGNSWLDFISIQAYPGETVWLSPGGGDQILYFANAQHYIEFDGINLNGAGVGFPIKIDHWSGGNANHLRFQNAEIIGPTNGITGEGLDAGGSAIVVSQSVAGTSGSNEFLNLVIHGGGDAGDFAYAAYFNSSNNRIEGCHIYDTSGAGVQVYNGYGITPVGNTIQKNRIHAITRSGDTGAFRRYWGIIDVGSGTIIRNNLIYDIGAGADGDGIQLYGGSGALVQNNTIRDCRGYGVQIFDANTATLRNNAIVDCGTDIAITGSATGTTQDHNWTTADGDPLFTDPSAGDFTEQLTSPLIDAGVTIAAVTDDFLGAARPAGAAYDIGAYESGATGGGPGVPPDDPDPSGPTGPTGPFSMQFCVKVIATRNGPGVQTITNIRDRSGATFVGKLFIPIGGYAAANTLTNSPSAFHMDVGVDDGTRGGAFGTGDIYGFAAKFCSGIAAGRYSVVDTTPSIFPGAAGYAYISDSRDGEADLTWVSKTRDGQSLILAIFGGDNLTIDVNAAGILDGVYTTTDAPVALLNLPVASWTTTPGVSGGAGGAPVNWGWDTKTSGRAAFSASAFNQSTNARALFTDRCAIQVGTAALSGGTPLVSDWGALSYTLSGVTTALPMLKVAFSGTGIEVTAGAFIQEDTEYQEFETGVDVAALLLGSVGNIASGGLDTAMCQQVIGWSDRTRQASYWTGETVNGNGTPLTGARYLSDTDVLRFATPDGSSTTFEAVAELVSISATGRVRVRWLVNDGMAREVAWLAFGGTPTPIPGCSGGGAITVVGDPPVGETFTGRTISPRAWVTFAFDDEDRSLALDRYNHPPDYFGGIRLGYLLSFGSINRQLSDRFSSYKMADVSFEVDDSARLLSTLEDTAESEHWYNREGRVYLASPATIAAAGTPHVLFRGIWRQHVSRGLKRSLQLTDALGSEFSDLNLERTIPSELIGRSFTAATDEVKAKVVPIAMGKWIDESGVDGDPVENVVAVAVPQDGSAPTGFTATRVAGTTGVFGETVYYGLSFVVAGVESPIAFCTCGGGDDATRWIQLDWDTPTVGTTEIRLYRASRSDYRQFNLLTTESSDAPITLTVSDVTWTDQWVGLDQASKQQGNPDAQDQPWILGLRMNVDYYVWAKLAGGVLSHPGTAFIDFMPINFTRDRTAEVSWDAYPGALGYVVIRHRNYYSNWGPEFDARWDVGASVLTLTDVMTAAVTTVAVPGVPTGCLPLIDVNLRRMIGGTLTRGLLLCKGAIQHVEQIYRSRAVQGVGPYSPTDAETFDLVPEADYGVHWWAPGKAGYPDATNYYVINDQWYTIIWTDVDPLPVSIRVNACTRTDAPDGTGSVITGGPRGIFHLLNQEILPAPEEVWVADDYLLPRAFSDGTPLVNSASVAAAEAIEVARLADLSTDAEPYEDGYQLQLYLDQPITIREFLARCLGSFDLRFGQNNHGQLVMLHLNAFTDLTSCRQVSDVREIQADTSIDRRLSELENRVEFDWGWRPAANEFDYPKSQIQDDAAIAANRGRIAVGDALQFWFTRNAATVDSVAGWRLAFGKYPPRYVTMTGPLHWLTIKLGDIIRATDCEGIGATGWIDRPLWVVGIQTTIGDLTTAPDVALTCIDVKRFLQAFGGFTSDDADDWDDAPDEDRAANMYFSDDDGLLTDGSHGKDFA